LLARIPAWKRHTAYRASPSCSGALPSDGDEHRKHHTQTPCQLLLHDTHPISNPPHYPPVFGLLGPSNNYNYYIQTRILPAADGTYESIIVPANTFLRQDFRDQLSRWLWPWPIMGTCFSSSSSPHTAEQRGREPFSASREILHTSLTYHIPNVP